MPAQAIEGLLGHPPEVFKATFEGAERLAAESGDEYATNGVVMLKQALPKIESAITVAKNYIPRVLEEIAPVHRRYPFALTRLPTDTRLLGGLDQLRSLMTGLNLMTRLSLNHPERLGSPQASSPPLPPWAPWAVQRRQRPNLYAIWESQHLTRRLPSGRVNCGPPRSKHTYLLTNG